MQQQILVLNILTNELYSSNVLGKLDFTKKLIQFTFFYRF